MAQSNLDEISKLLREARETQGISISEVAAATKINTKILDALEQGDLGQLPPKAFLRGFVLSYAKFLKLDSQVVLNAFQKAFGVTTYQPATRAEASERESTLLPLSSEQMAVEAANKRSSQVARLLWSGLIVVLVFVIYFVSMLIDKYKKESETSGTVQALSDKVVPLSSVTPLPTNGSAAVLANPATPNPSPSPEAKMKFNLVIEALDTVDIQFRADNGTVEKARLAPEQKQTIRGDKSIGVEASDGGAIMINLNGIDKGVPGDLGKPLKLKYP